eukprot:gene7383-8604_t
MPPALHISSPMHHGQLPAQVHLFNYSPSSSPTPYFASGQMCPTSPPFGLNTPSLHGEKSGPTNHLNNHNNNNNNISDGEPSVVDSGAILECFIELRDLGSSISKQSKESMVSGDFVSGLDRIKATLSSLITKVDSIDISMQNIIQNCGDPRVFGNNDEGRVPVLTRPRRFRKSKVKNKQEHSIGSNNNNMPQSAEHALDLLAAGGDASKVAIGNGGGATKRKSTEIKHCTSCGTTSSPEWRKGPAGNQSLCNACGLYFAKLVRREASLAWKPQSVVKVNDLLCGGLVASGNIINVGGAGGGSIDEKNK